MDCEGAEVTILENLEIRPQYIIIESHGTQESIIESLSDMGYEIVSKEPAETRFPQEKIEEWGLYTFVAELQRD
jgi:hypothetical protein